MKFVEQETGETGENDIESFVHAFFGGTARGAGKLLTPKKNKHKSLTVVLTGLTGLMFPLKPVRA